MIHMDAQLAGLLFHLQDLKLASRCPLEFGDRWFQMLAQPPTPAVAHSRDPGPSPGSECRPGVMRPQNHVTVNCRRAGERRSTLEIRSAQPILPLERMVPARRLSRTQISAAVLRRLQVRYWTWKAHARSGQRWSRDDVR